LHLNYEDYLTLRPALSLPKVGAGGQKTGVSVKVAFRKKDTLQITQGRIFSSKIGFKVINLYLLKDSLII
jgi:hypothetical protein